MKNFFKNKFNIVFTVIQIIALFFMCLSGLSGIFMIIAIILEGVFFIVYGVSCFYKNKIMKSNNDLYNMLPGSEINNEVNEKQLSKSNKFNKLKGVMFILFGLVLVFILIL